MKLTLCIGGILSSLVYCGGASLHFIPLTAVMYTVNSTPAQLESCAGVLLTVAYTRKPVYLPIRSITKVGIPGHYAASFHVGLHFCSSNNYASGKHITQYISKLQRIFSALY